MSDLQIFNFNSNPVRVELFDNQAYEYLSVLRTTNQTLNRLTKDIDIDPMTNWRVLNHLRKFDLKAVKIDF